MGCLRFARVVVDSGLQEEVVEQMIRIQDEQRLVVCMYSGRAGGVWMWCTKLA
jgi:hypothetical protein